MWKFISILSFFITISSLADGITTLQHFLKNTKTLQAQFQQTVKNRQGKILQTAQGIVMLSRPGRFRWEYKTPYQQLIVGDGKKLWLYDKDINQVTVQALQKAIGTSPAAFLAGDQEIEQTFTLKALSEKEVEALPKSTENLFQKIKLQFNQNTLDTMTMTDNLGQTTIIQLQKVIKNPTLPASQFQFSPPAGVDVLTQ